MAFGGRVCVRVRIGRRLAVPEGARLAGIIRAAYAGAVPFIGRTLDPANGHLSAIGLVPLKNSLAFAVQDAQRHRFRWEGEICYSNNCSGHVQRLNFDLAEDRQPTTWRSANKLNPKRQRRGARMRFISSSGAACE
jgi:hypothetical protein